MAKRRRISLGKFLKQKKEKGRLAWFEQKMLPYEKATEQMGFWIDDYFKSLRKKSMYLKVFDDTSYKPEYLGAPKSFGSVYEKIYDGKLKEEEIFSKLTDLARARIVVRYINQIGFLVEDLVMRYLRKNKKCELESETAIQDYIENSEDSGYRSLHVNLNVPVKVSKKKLMIPFELQVRTDIEDAWAKISHSLFYKNRAFKALTSQERQYIEREMRKISDLLFVADGMMQNARDEVKKLTK